jgi:hypothetical protein
MTTKNNPKAKKPPKKRVEAIFSLLQKLVAESRENVLEYQTFVEADIALRDFFHQLLPDKEPFQLSESYPEIWLSPEFYTTPGGFSRSFLTTYGRDTPNNVETVEEQELFLLAMYWFIYHKTEGFARVSLLSKRGAEDISGLPLPDFQIQTTGAPEEAVERASAVPRPAFGHLLELHVSETPIQTPVILTGATQAGRITGQLSLITHDTVVVAHGEIDPDFLTRTTEEVFSRISLEGVPEYDAPILDTAVAIETKKTLIRVKRFVYRDSSGDIHEQNFSQENEIPLSQLGGHLTDLENRAAVEPESFTGRPEAGSPVTASFTGRPEAGSPVTAAGPA